MIMCFRKEALPHNSMSARMVPARWRPMVHMVYSLPLVHSALEGFVVVSAADLHAITVLTRQLVIR